MLLINSIKILFSNLPSMWKALLYKLIAMLVFAILFAAIVYPQLYSLISAIRRTGLFENFQDALIKTLTIKPEVGDAAVLFNESLNASLEVLTKSGFSYIAIYICTIVIYLVYRFLNKLFDIPLAISLEANLTSCAKIPLLSLFIKNIKKSAKYSAFTLLITLPFDILIVVIVWLLAQVFFIWFSFFALFFLIIIVIMLVSFKSVLFSLWKPAIVVDGKDVMPAFRASLKIAFKNFWLLYSYYIVIYFAEIFINLMIAFFTCGAGLIISLPVSILITSIFQVVFYFSYRRKKYYVDGDTIIQGRLDHTMPDLEPAEALENNDNDSEK